MPITRCKIIVALLFTVLFAVSSQAQTFTSSAHPIVIVNTNGASIPDEPKILGSMRIINNGPGIINQITDPANEYKGGIGIETRGNSTQDFDKKTYALETRDIADNDSAVSLLGMGKEEDWILHAMVIDKSLLRIPMSFYLAQRMGHYAANWRYVELVLNGDYRGLYILTERIKRDDDRVDLAKLTDTDLSGDAVTGGYILRIDWLDDPKGFESQYDAQGGDPMFYQWYYPKASKIEPQQAAYIKSYMGDFEDAVFDATYRNANGQRYTDLIDVTSFVDFLLINELSKNADGYKLSSYLYKDRNSIDSRLHAGPIWDFDQTYGLSTVCSNDDPSGWTYRQEQPGCEDLETMPRWWRKMMKDSVFTNHLACRWKQHRDSPLHADSLNHWIDAHVNLISDAVDRNFARWPNVIGEEIWYEPEPIPQSYPAEIAYMKSWILDRLQWMDANMPGNCNNDIVSVGPRLFQEDRTVKAYPNPVSNLLFVHAETGDQLTLINIRGQIIYQRQLQRQADLIHEIDVSGMPPGVYLLSVRSAEAITNTKLVIR